MNNECVLELNNVVKSYDGKHIILNNINLKVYKGEFVALLGVNGAGKTTLISAIAGINKFIGNIKVCGFDVISDLVKAKYQLGIVPQEITFDPFLTVYQTLKFQSGLYGIYDNEAWIHELLKRMHLSDKINSKTRSLSGGMKRRLMVAQALVHKPKLIILDEPTAGVDVELRKILWQFFIELKDNGHTILLTTHYLDEVEELCSRIILLNKGEITFNDTQEKLSQNFKHLRSFFSIMLENEEKVLFAKQIFGTSIIKVEENALLFIFNQSNDILDILNKCKENNLNVLSIKTIHPKLEDMFVESVN